MERTRWYEPRIDPAAAAEFAEAAMYGRSMPQRHYVGPDYNPDFDSAPNLIGSLCEGEVGGTASSLHMPVIDFDAIPMRLVASSTPGNFHLYIDKPVTWAHYVAILEALDAAGLVEHDYVAASINQGSTFVRPKGYKRLDVRKVGKQVIAENAQALEIVRQAEAQSDHRDALVCCGDPGDCGRPCNMGRH